MAPASLSLHRSLRRLVPCLAGVLLVVLASCGGPGTTTTPTPTPSLPTGLQYTTFDLKLPPEALNAPVVGPLPDSTPLHVSISFKLNQQVVNQLNTKKVQKGQGQNAQGLANQLGISDAEYQQIKAFYGVENASLNLNKLHTDLAIDAKASTFAKVFQIKFLIHKLNGRTFYTPDHNPQVPALIASQILAITGLDSYTLKNRPGFLLQRSTVKASGGRKKAGADCSFDSSLLSWSDLAQYYGYDQLYKAGYYGEGMTVNLVELGDAFSPSEVQNYYKAAAANQLQPYYDITRGNNLYYPATPGWDFTSGLGSPNLPDFFKTLLQAAKQ